MLTTQDTLTLLNRYTFWSIWNEARSEYRVNIELHPLHRVYNKNTVRTNDTTYVLPDNQLHMVFQTAHWTTFGGLKTPLHTWISGEELANTYRTLTYLYGRDGVLVPRNRYMLRQISLNRVLITIHAKAYNDLLGYDYTPLYLTLYRDTDIDHQFLSRSWYIDPLDPLYTVQGLQAHVTDCLTRNSAGTTILINGVEIDQDYTTPIWYEGDYVDVMFDENVIGSYHVEVQDVSGGYYSDKYEHYREVLHCPKALNPQNKLITHDTCTFSVIDPETGQGRYFQQTDTHAVGQVTHNDLSVKSSLVEAVRQRMGVNRVVVKVRVRTHDKDNVLTHTTTYLDYLYRLDDDTILRILNGGEDDSLPFWKASVLEQSHYVAWMIDSPNRTDPQLMDGYIQGLGYYTIAQILASHTQPIELPDVNHRYFTMYRPPAYRGIPVEVFIYVNGYKINQAHITTYQQDGETVGVKIGPGPILTEDDDITVTMMEAGITHTYHTQGMDHVVVPYEHVAVYVSRPLTTLIQGHRITAAVSYQRLEIEPGVVTVTSGSGSSRIDISPQYQMEEIIVQNARYTHTQNTAIDDQMTVDQGAITIPLTTQSLDGQPYPLLGYDHVEVYCNQHRLIEGIDYILKPMYAPNGHIAFTEIVISTFDYLRPSGNYIETIATTMSAPYVDKGYLFNNKISFDDRITVWHPGLTRCWVKGRLVHPDIEEGHYLQTSDTENGDPYLVETTIPSVLKTVLMTDPNAMDDRYLAVLRYFIRTVDVSRDPLIITRSHRVHSPYISEIVKDLCTHQRIAVNDPSDRLFLQQFRDYDYLRERDPYFTGTIDLRYVDINPIYLNWIAPSPEIYRIIHRFLTLVQRDPHSFGDILDG